MNKTVGVQSNDLRETNRLSILKLLQKKVASRADLSAELGLSKPAVSTIVAELLGQGFVKEIGHGESKDTGGKRPILLCVNEDAGLFISIYFNSDWHEIALMNLGQEIVAYEKQSTIIHSDFRQTFTELADRVQSLIQQVRAKGNQQRVVACGIVAKGTVHADRGVMSYSATIPDWRDIPIAEFMESRLQVPVFIENDARANTLFELSHHQTKPDGTLVYVSVGPGIGTGVVMDDKIYRGNLGGAVNFAHTAIVQDGELCSCGNRGCWESLASTNAFLAELGRRDDGCKGLTLQQALERYKKTEDNVVYDVLYRYTAYWLGIGLANIMNIFNPDTIIIQSEINQVGDWFRERIEEVGKKRALPFAATTSIVYSRDHDYLQIRSAFAVVMQHFLTKEHHKKFLCSEKPGGSQ